jgi:outer membrane protein assembly factor BamD
MGPVVTTQRISFPHQVIRFAALGAMVVLLAGCNMFGQPKIKDEAIVPPETLYQQALGEMDAQRYVTAVATLEKLERQHPFSELNEKSKLMQVYAYYRIGKFDEAIAAADRYMAVYPGSKETAYVLYLKGNAYFGQIKDTTRDQKISQNAIETYTLLISNYPKSEYAKDAKDKLKIGVDQLAGKEMSVGRYYLGQGQYAAAINRFRVVAEQFQSSTHIEEALYRLTEANLALGLTSEAATAAAVLGHNYPQSSWYKQAYDLLAKQGVTPSVNQGSSLAKLKRA